MSSKARKQKPKFRSKKIRTKEAEVLVIENPPGNPLASDDDFMQALHDFQYGEGEVSEQGFERMRKRLEK